MLKKIWGKNYEIFFLLFMITMLAACSSNSDTGSSGAGIESILSGNQIIYTEQDEENNNARAFAEDTGYILNENGIESRGVLALNSLDTAGDQYLIYSGSTNKIDLQVFLNGVGLTNDAPVVETIFDALNDDGVSILTSNSFRDIPIFTDTYYLVSINLAFSNDAALNQPYVIEVKAAN